MKNPFLHFLLKICLFILKALLKLLALVYFVYSSLPFIGAIYVFWTQCETFLKIGEWVHISFADFLFMLSTHESVYSGITHAQYFSYPEYKGIEMIVNWFFGLNASLVLTIIGLCWVTLTWPIYRVGLKIFLALVGDDDIKD